jgi:cell wall-associated NlpC family hydrolase
MKRMAPILVFVLAGTVLPLLAQRPRTVSRRSQAQHLPHQRLLSRNLGERVAETALNTHAWDYFGSDCSHFVNAIFEAVGLPFRYQNSITLYTGTEEFRRVFHPQPGDLIVWRGHVGIVVDPGEHTFYSMLRKGLRLASYDSPYWRSRGPVRFLRYAAKTQMAERHTVRVARLQAGSQ